MTTTTTKGNTKMFTVIYKKKLGGKFTARKSLATTKRRAYDETLRANPKGYIQAVIQNHRFVA